MRNRKNYIVCHQGEDPKEMKGNAELEATEQMPEAYYFTTKQEFSMVKEAIGWGKDSIQIEKTLQVVTKKCKETRELLEKSSERILHTNQKLRIAREEYQAKEQTKNRAFQTEGQFNKQARAEKEKNSAKRARKRISKMLKSAKDEHEDMERLLSVYEAAYTLALRALILASK